MIRQTIIIKNEYGLHALPASRFVKAGDRFKSEVRLIKDGIEVDGKSIMGILTLACEKGSKVELIVSGIDENEAFAVLSKILEGEEHGK
ncbi:MAG: HPr family phosphocarrier protein [candidate division WOR-3 bacterium]